MAGTVSTIHGGARRGAGRKRGQVSAETAELRRLAQLHTAAALETIAELMQPGNPPAIRLGAAETLLERGYGRVHTAAVPGDDEPDSGSAANAPNGMGEVYRMLDSLRVSGSAA